MLFKVFNNIYLFKSYGWPKSDGFFGVSKMLITLDNRQKMTENNQKIGKID